MVILFQFQKQELLNERAEIGVLNDKLNTAWSEHQAIAQEKESLAKQYAEDKLSFEASREDRKQLKHELENLKATLIQNGMMLSRLETLLLEEQNEHDILAISRADQSDIRKLQQVVDINQAKFTDLRRANVTRSFNELRKLPNFKYFPHVFKGLSFEKLIPDFVPSRVVQFFLENNLIEKDLETEGFRITDLGSDFITLYNERQL